MTGSANDVVLGRQVDAALRVIKQYILSQDLALANAIADDLQNAVGGISVFEGATANTAGSKGLVPAPISGDNEKYLRGDGTWATVSGGGGTSDDFVGADASNPGVKGLVPAPQPAESGKFLRGDGTWAAVGSVSMSVISTVQSAVEGAIWQDEINGAAVLKLRHGDYEYNFNYDNLIYLGAPNSTPETVTPDTYIIGTNPSTLEGGFWYDVNEKNTPTLNFRNGNYNYGFNYDTITYKGGNKYLKSYLPFDTSPTADACGNVWRSGDISTGGVWVVDECGISFGGENDPVPIGRGYLQFNQGGGIWGENIFNINAAAWTIDFWYNTSGNNNYYCKFGCDEDADLGGILFRYSGIAFYDREGSEIVNIDTQQAKDEWFHFALVKDGLTYYVFFDGELQGSYTFTAEEHDTLYFGKWTYLGHAASYAWMAFDSFRVREGIAVWKENFTVPDENDYK